MAIGGSREHELARPAGAEAPPHPPQSPSASPGGLDSFIRAWDSDIKRAASHTARDRGFSYDTAQDFAQAARIALVRVSEQANECGSFYVRRVIQNAVRDAARQERRLFGTLLGMDNHALDFVVDPKSEKQSHIIAAVAEWVSLLPSRLRQVYELLYVQGHTQREAAELMRVSQPRISQLHNELLRRGRAEPMLSVA